ncbi:putative phage abortive infection protein [Asticcacaulis sp.]|uniref:putative phage abortive infection protein n=1 Tax=Asticcacaulis sp. TaxID=1872648 RepID=UPI0026313A1F|nr:putative phage abortive infection protein [Asticcacaulis sp.]
MSDDKRKTRSQWFETYWVLVAVLVVATAWLLNLGFGWAQLWAALKADSDETHINAGVFGDMFGAVNALFSGLSIIGIVYAIRQQDQQLKLAREEVKTAQETLKIAIEDADKTKSILEEQQKQLSIQNKSVSLQLFENTFFNIIENIRNNVSEMRYNEESGQTRLNSIKNSFLSTIKFTEDEELIALNLSDMLKRNNITRNNLSSYIKLINTLINFVNEFENENKKIYYDIIASSMSSSEVVIIFYYSILDKTFGRNTLSDFIEQRKLKNVVLYEIKMFEGSS